MEDFTVFKDRVRGMYSGVAYGDACGMSVETMKREEIAKLNGGLGVTCYMDPIQMRVEDTKHLKFGDTTDDWQLTRAVNTSLVHSRGFDLHDQMRVHLDELAHSTFGWGKGTMHSLKELHDGERTPEQAPLWSGEGKGSGNGVIMKIAPMAAMSAITGRSLTCEILQLGKMTHPDMRARIAPISVHRFLVMALRGDASVRCSALLESMYRSEHIEFIRALEEKHIEDKEKTYFLSNHLARIDISSIDSLIATAGVGFTAWQTAAFALGVYMRHPKDFTKALLEAVNAGGDTDTNASVVGGLVGATIGYDAIPDQWKGIPVTLEALNAADALCEAFS